MSAYFLRKALLLASVSANARLAKSTLVRSARSFFEETRKSCPDPAREEDVGLLISSGASIAETELYFERAQLQSLDLLPKVGQVFEGLNSLMALMALRSTVSIIKLKFGVDESLDRLFIRSGRPLKENGGGFAFELNLFPQENHEAYLRILAYGYKTVAQRNNNPGYIDNLVEAMPPDLAAVLSLFGRKPNVLMVGEVGKADSQLVQMIFHWSNDLDLVQKLQAVCEGEENSVPARLESILYKSEGSVYLPQYLALCQNIS